MTSFVQRDSFVSFWKPEVSLFCVSAMTSMASSFDYSEKRNSLYYLIHASPINLPQTDGSFQVCA